MALNNVSSSLNESPFHFFKVMLSPFLQEMNRRIPPKFVKNFGSEISDAVTLIVPNGSKWEVSLKKNGKGFWFHNGWNDFTNYYSISAGYFVVFKYAKNSTFHVFIYNFSTCEIDYPCKCEESKTEVLLEKNDFDDDIEYDLCALLGKMGIYIAERRKLKGEASKRAVEIARSLKLKKPTFMIILQPSDIKYRVVYVPSKFANKYFRKNAKAIKVQVSGDQREQSFEMYWRANGGSVIRKGWAEVLKDKNLVEGDICVFELMSSEDVVLKLSIFKA